MAWWKWFEQRATPQTQWSLSELASWDDMGVGSGPTASGLTMTPERAVSVPAVYSCISVLSQDVAKTPLKLRRRLGVDSFEDAPDHALSEILGTLANAETSAFQFKREMTANLLTYEQAYAEIVRTDGRITALWVLDPKRMYITRDAMRRKVYHYTLDNGRTQTWTFDASMPPILDLQHPSPVRQCRDLIASALALQTYVGKFFAQGGRPSGVLTAAGQVSQGSLDRLRVAWNDIHGGVNNAHRIAILEGGLKFEPIASLNSDAQLNETYQSLRTEIAATFRLPAWKVGDTSKMNYSNMESGAIEYATGTLDPYFVVWEEAVRRDCLTARQYSQFTVTFDRQSLMRSDAKSLAESLATGRQNGWFSANDIRRKLGENPIPASAGGDAYLMNTSLAPVGKADDDAA